ncbi:MAG: FkbM family methyltransferase [Gammaproteobacteria bacterium]|nr:FkbM family methyltransferase [Gammaproteobacteria bacterium]
MTKREEVLFLKLKQKNIPFKHVAEVGVYLPQTSNIGAFTKEGIRSTFIEPDPNSIEAINKYFKDMDNVNIHPVAIFDKAGSVELVQRKASTYLKILDSSPAIINDEYTLDDEDTFTVDAVTFNQIDDGSIDLLSIDIEGGEWFVIKHMVSRPLVLSIETHGAMYINPYIDEIKKWMSKNGYIVWYMDSSDTVYIKPGLFNISFLDKLNLFLTNIRLGYKKYRKTIKRKIKKTFRFK